ncbi:CGNR zinc finger domain-containing protein [Nocardia sp. NPDC052566]|uniref:CGNR zinc finger domain-containing protein n=1 Tax=Nocardia sp. NPDC052566 TaxID=3364330 RepID=UPI0037C8851D
MADRVGETAADGGVPAGAARLVAFVNTRHADGDHLGTPAQLTAWLHTNGLLPHEVTATEAERDRARRVREGIRALFARNNAEPVASPRPDGLDPAAHAELAALTQDLTLTVDVTELPPRLVPTSEAPVDRALATLLADIAAAAGDGSWTRLKTCREPSCRWAFYDQSRNRGRTWCSMNLCGNRVKVRASRRKAVGG